MCTSRSCSVPILDSWTQTTARSLPTFRIAPYSPHGQKAALGPDHRHRSQASVPPQKIHAHHRSSERHHHSPAYASTPAHRPAKLRESLNGRCMAPPPRPRPRLFDDAYFTWHGSPERCGLPAGRPTWLQDRFAPGFTVALSPTQYWRAANAPFAFGAHKDAWFTESTFIPNRAASLIGTWR
eukprot:GEMP01044762.1.p1 GENE.GEMP01044762.1~~GEMP01044762.1.p1  ORF type:complete len:182 (+),score=36.14 GEMP01044762.1:66-611(+)